MEFSITSITGKSTPKSLGSSAEKLKPRVARFLVPAICVPLLMASATAGGMDRASQPSPALREAMPRQSVSVPQPTTRFVLSDLKIDGDVHDRDGVRARVLSAFKYREFGDVEQLDEIVQRRVRADFQDRGYFRVALLPADTRRLATSDGKQFLLLTISAKEGEQYHLGTLAVNAPDAPQTEPPPEVVERLVNLRRGDLLDAGELRAGLNELMGWYVDQGYAKARTVSAFPEFKIDDAHHVIDVTITLSN